MPPLEASHFSRKRKQPEPPSERLSKKQQLDHSLSYWDNLSEIHLTKNAIREHDRRNNALKQLLKLRKPVDRQHRRPITCLFQAERESRPKPIPPTDFLSDCSPGQLREIKRLSRLGGPDLSDLKNYPVSMSPGTSSSSRKRRAKSPPSSARDTKTTTKASSAAYSRNFQQKLIDHGIYPDGYEYPDGQIPSTPNNMEEILELLAQPRPSLSSSKFSDGDFRKFNDHHFFGARSEQLNHSIREALSDQIMPSTQDDFSMTPNFFLEAKGPDGSLAVATHGRHATMAPWVPAEWMLYNPTSRMNRPTITNAYILTSTYHGAQLKMYATHIGKPHARNSRREYFMTPIEYLGHDWELGVVSARSFCLPKWHSEAHSPISQGRTSSDLTPILDDSDGSTEPEYQDAQ
ncbi:hypothetical protein AJ78_01655 [Emergomyces pasteurianus Ep9510]|uniref:Uncharacterized protein n=1 Tax=Emergomyces pasteurianus Ep9510 TaxID=1447872 RepID=A0A1J9PQ78_9EURO|nr:hypothetical protein AJ78_01655 [Emergomyces pasteurianus Ep9510]